MKTFGISLTIKKSLVIPVKAETSEEALEIINRRMADGDETLIDEVEDAIDGYEWDTKHIPKW